MANRRLAEPIDVIGGRHGKTALNNHAIAFASPPMADRAIDLKALSAALKQIAGDRDRESCYQIGSDFAGIECLVFVYVASGDSVHDDGTRGHLVVLEEVAAAERLAGGLVEHVGAASGKK